jgi:Zn finger protein HypA/HybF involved in hydrogenase expression
VRPSKINKRKRRYPSPEIEDVQEPFCGSRLKTLVPLCDADPVVAAEWFYEKNCGWGPEHFSRGSNVKAWWQCPYCLRTYKATICNRVGNMSTCPYCASKKVCSDNALSDLFPDVAKEWHPTKNGKLNPTQVMRFSAKRAWWLCRKCLYEWNTAISDRTYLSAGCPACYRARIEYEKQHHVKAIRRPIVLGEKGEAVPRSWYEDPNRKVKSLADSNPKIAREWHPTKNGKWTPRDFARASGVKAWWKCNKGPDHEWQATICHRTKSGRGCPFCAGQRASITNSLKGLYPQIAKEWHKKRNGKLTPSDVTSRSEKKVWWQCKRFPDHEWETIVAVRTNGGGCPQCSNAKVSKQNSLKTKFPYLAAQLHPTKNGDLKGDQIIAHSKKKVWWFCKNGPDHVWQATPSDRTIKGSGCPACAGKKVSVTNSLASLFPQIAREWHKTKNGKLRASDVTSRSDRSVWWQCHQGHSWQQRIGKRTTRLGRCPKCKALRL